MTNQRPTIGVGTLQLTSEAKRLVMQVLDSNRLSYGPMSQTFEETFAEIHGCQFGVVSNSGTSALHVAVAALKEIHKWNDGDEVIVPAVTFVATLNVVLHNNLKPVIVDVDPEHYDMDPVKLAEAVTPKTRAIIPVHLFGQPCDMDPIMSIATEHDLRVIEDSCETMFAQYRGRSVGSIGDIGCFSTYVAHLLSTGIGGLNTTNVPEYAIKLRSLVNHGRDSIYLSIDDDDNLGEERLRSVVERRFKFISPGHSFRITEMEAALGVAQLKTRDEMLTARRANGRFLMQALEPISDHLQLPSVRPGSDHSFMMFPLVVREAAKNELVMHLEQHGIETRDMLPLTNQPVYRRMLDIREDDFPIAKRINDHGFYIGCHQDLTSADLDYIVEVLQTYFQPSPTAQKTSIALLVTSRSIASHARDLVEQLPLDKFSEVIVATNAARTDIASAFGDHPFSHIDQQVADPWSFVQKSDTFDRFEHVIAFGLDGRDDPSLIGPLIMSLERGNDMVIASRFIVGSGDVAGSPSASRRTGNRLFSLLANLVFAGNITDTLSTFRGVSIAKLRTAPISQRGLAATYELSISAMRHRWRVAEIPVVEQEIPDRSLTLRALGSVIPLIIALIAHAFGRRSRHESS